MGLGLAQGLGALMNLRTEVRPRYIINHLSSDVDIFHPFFELHYIIFKIWLFRCIKTDFYSHFLSTLHMTCFRTFLLGYTYCYGLSKEI